MVYCTECGFANNEHDAFCSQCGSPLERPSGSVSAAPPMPGFEGDGPTLMNPDAANGQPTANMPGSTAQGGIPMPAAAVPSTSSTTSNTSTNAPANPAAAPSVGAGIASNANKGSNALIAVLLVSICAVALAIGLFITHAMGVWGSSDQTQTAQASSAETVENGEQGDDSADSKGSSSKNKKKANSGKDASEDSEGADESKSDTRKETGKESEPAVPVITSSQLSGIADSYSSSDVAVAALVIDDDTDAADATVAATTQAGTQFVAAGLYLPVYLAAQSNGDDNAKSQASVMMSDMDNNAGNAAAAALGGWSSVNSWASSNGYGNTTFNRDYGDVAASNAGYENYSSAKDATRMLAAVDAKGASDLMNVDIASEGVVIPSGMTVHAHRGQGIQNTWNYFAVVEAHGHKAAVSVVTQNQGQAVAAELMSKVLASVDSTLDQ
ncbi:serine hydrolase [Bifidobacterium olomucense]|uniref:Beta-lactamase class A-like protein n=1 Tax=Bifidobacterium olomucense TaxID=2675324 RepID=A0A7Y0EXM6_9BIFI|nr:serine hydrolase [Bifidobacterium sp. DSM 109959]NMM98264.1 hypothetical protein [Bifidobacterium sp. DSM 109959]